jgi:NitT/TauT family transport system ATP-binding protein
MSEGAAREAAMPADPIDTSGRPSGAVAAAAPLAPAAAAPATAAVKLRIAGLRLSFSGDGKTTPVLDGIDLTVAAGEFVCLVGASGCGKTTLLNVVGGFLRADEGQMLIDGSPVRGPDPRRIFVFQERGVFPWLTVTGNIGFGLWALPAAEREARVRGLVQLVGLEGFEGAYPHELSGGMKQRVEVARALAVDPDMLFLDEPFGALDSITRLTLRRELLRIWRAAQHKTILFVTHDIEEAVQLADRIVVLSPRPARVRRIVEIDIPHPRDLSSRRYLELRDGIFEEIGLAHRV